MLPSLLAWDPAHWSLPAFKDLVQSVIPVIPAFYIKGSVVKGFGRGSKVGAPLRGSNTAGERWSGHLLLSAFLAVSLGVQACAM